MGGGIPSLAWQLKELLNKISALIRIATHA